MTHKFVESDKKSSMDLYDKICQLLHQNNHDKMCLWPNKKSAHRLDLKLFLLFAL